MPSTDTEFQEQMQQQMKQRLENLPRFTYKVTRFFKNKSDLQQAIDDLNNGGIPNLSSKKLTDNYIEEIYEMCFLFKVEGKKNFKRVYIWSFNRYNFRNIAGNWIFGLSYFKSYFSWRNDSFNINNLTDYICNMWRFYSYSFTF